MRDRETKTDHAFCDIMVVESHYWLISVACFPDRPLSSLKSVKPSPLLLMILDFSDREREILLGFFRSSQLTFSLTLAGTWRVMGMSALFVSHLFASPFFHYINHIHFFIEYNLHTKPIDINIYVYHEVPLCPLLVISNFSRLVPFLVKDRALRDGLKQISSLSCRDL